MCTLVCTAGHGKRKKPEKPGFSLELMTRLEPIGNLQAQKKGGQKYKFSHFLLEKFRIWKNKVCTALCTLCVCEHL
nr:MAG TPA: hypothetical protein [Bacteriophage sp.]